MRNSERLYRALLRAYPSAFRRAHEEAMVQWFRDHARATAHRGGLRAWTGFWLLVLSDLARSLVREHRRARRLRATDPTPGDGGPPLLDGLVQDARVALRTFTRRPAFFALAVTTLGMGVGSATAVYSTVHRVLLAPLPYEQPERIVRVGKISEGRAGVLSVSAPDFEDLRARARSFEALAASRPATLPMAGEGEPELVRVAMVSSDFFDVLGRHPVLGRTWDPAEDRTGTAPVIVVGHGLWERRWGGDPTLVGRTVAVGGGSFTVLGVMPPDFVPPEGLGHRGAEAWIPLALIDPEARQQRSNQFLQLLGRLAPEATLEGAGAELEALGQALSTEFPEPGARRFGLSPLHRETVGSIGDTMLPVLGAVLLLLGIACVNVANLLLIRTVERKKELSVRRAVGARRGRLIRQLVTESVIIGLAGGLLGAALSVLGVRVFAALAPVGVPRMAEVTAGNGVLLTAMGTALLTSVVFGVFPAVSGSRADLGATMRRGSGGTGGTTSDAWVRDGMMAVQAALSVVLVAAAALLGSSLLRLGAVDLGYDPTGVQVISVAHPGPSADETAAFYRTVLDRIASLPGVASVGATDHLPLSGNRQQTRIRADGLRLSAEDQEFGGLPVNYQHVTPGYFATMTVDVAEGRAFAEADGPGGEPVALVNRTLADALAGGGSAVGLRVTFGDDEDGTRPYRVVGVTADLRQRAVDAPPEPEVFLAFAQHPRGRMEIVARGRAGDTALLPAMREAVRGVRSDLPVRRLASMSDVTAQSVADRRFFAVMVGAFAVVALMLATVGVYGTLAFAVGRRRRELGVRIALGASASAVLGTVAVRTVAALVVGAAAGLVAAFAATRVLESLLFGVEPTDPVTLGAAVAAVLAAGAVAGIVPGVRAVRSDPVSSLRPQ